MENLKLKLTAIQKYPDHENKDVYPIEAVVAERNGSQYITFKQHHPEQNITITNLVKIKNGVVSIKRTGGLSSNMVFDIQKNYETIYETPYGQLDLKIITKEIESRILQNDVKLKIVYEMMMQGKKISDNIYCIEVQ